MSKEIEKKYGEVIIYTADNGNTKIDGSFVDETVWLSQQQMAALFKTSRTNIVEHIGNIYDEGELDRSSSCRDFRQVRKEGNRNVSRDIPFYNLDNILKSTGEDVLKDAGNISNKQAMKKALFEYRKYQIENLSLVEKNYLAEIKNIEKISKKGGKVDE